MFSAEVLGVHTLYAQDYHGYQIVSAADIGCPWARIEARLQVLNRELWICVSFDHVRAGRVYRIVITYSLQMTAEPTQDLDDVLGD